MPLSVASTPEARRLLLNLIAGLAAKIKTKTQVGAQYQTQTQATPSAALLAVLARGAVATNCCTPHSVTSQANSNCNSNTIAIRVQYAPRRCSISQNRRTAP